MTTTTHPGHATWSQITLATRMSCGAREPMLIDESGLKFRVLERNRWIEVELEDNDTYTVRLVSLTKNYERRIHVEREFVFVDSLNETIYRACNR